MKFKMQRNDTPQQNILMKIIIVNSDVTPKRLGQHVASVHNISRNASNTSSTRRQHVPNAFVTPLNDASNALINARCEKHLCALVACCMYVRPALSVRKLKL